MFQVRRLPIDAMLEFDVNQLCALVVTAAHVEVNLVSAQQSHRNVSRTKIVIRLLQVASRHSALAPAHRPDLLLEC